MFIYGSKNKERVNMVLEKLEKDELTMTHSLKFLVTHPTHPTSSSEYINIVCYAPLTNAMLEILYTVSGDV